MVIASTTKAGPGRLLFPQNNSRLQGYKLASNCLCNSPVEQMNSGMPRPHASAGPARRILTREDLEKNGFYYFALGPEEQKLYRDVLADPGMETEIAILRRLVRSVVAEPDSFKRLPRLIKTLGSLERLNEDIRKRFPLKPENNSVSQPARLRSIRF